MSVKQVNNISSVLDICGMCVMYGRKVISYRCHGKSF